VEVTPVKASRTYQSERVQRLLESELRLRAVLGPRDVQLFTRVGRGVKVSAGVVAVVKAMEVEGHPPSEYRRRVVIRIAIRILLNPAVSVK
jgi:hypothetical protein